MVQAKHIFLYEYNLRSEGNFKKYVYFRFLAFSLFHVKFEDDSKLFILKCILIIVNIEIHFLLISDLAAWVFLYFFRWQAFLPRSPHHLCREL